LFLLLKSIERFHCIGAAPLGAGLVAGTLHEVSLRIEFTIGLAFVGFVTFACGLGCGLLDSVLGTLYSALFWFVIGKFIN